MKRFIFILFLLIIILQKNLLASGKFGSQLSFIDQVPRYTKKEISRIEKKRNIYIPKLAKKIYSSEIEINEMCFISDDTSKYMIVKDIQPLVTIDRTSLRPTENSILFGYRKNVSSGLFFIDDNYIWYSGILDNGEVGKISFKLVEDSKNDK